MATSASFPCTFFYLADYHVQLRHDPLVEFEFAEIKEALHIDRTLAANVGYKSLFTTPGNRKRMRIIIALGFFSQVRLCCSTSCGAS